MLSKKQLKKKNPILSDSESETESESEIETENEIIAEGIIDDEDDNEEKEYEDDYIDEADEDIDTVNLKDIEKEESECYFEYDNIINEYEKLGPATRVPDDERITLNKLTKYEIVRILGIRAQQISVGAKTLVKNIEGKSPIEIAIYELRNKMTPFKIKRPLPNNTYEIWKIKEFDINIPESEEKNIAKSFN
jgi:DNA-directed RNA polymerase subunit K/omega